MKRLKNEAYYALETRRPSLPRLLQEQYRHVNAMMPLAYIMYEFGELRSSNPGDYKGRVCNFCRDSATICRHTFIWHTGVPRCSAF